MQLSCLWSRLLVATALASLAVPKRFHLSLACEAQPLRVHRTRVSASPLLLVAEKSFEMAQKSLLSPNEFHSTDTTLLSAPAKYDHVASMRYPHAQREERAKDVPKSPPEVH